MNSFDDVKVIIYCTAYNHEPYIRDALDGFVMQQTNFKFLAIVHDDASTDNTADIIREYEAKYPDVIKAIYQTENQYSKGKSIRKIVLNFAPYGKYVAVCEGDDYWTDPAKLQTQYDFLETHPDYSLHTHEVTKLDMRTGEEDTYTLGMKEGEVSLSILCKSAYGFPHTSSLFIRRELFAMPEWMPQGVNGDRATVLYCAVNGKVYFLERRLSLYRRYSGGDSWSTRKDQYPGIVIKMYQNYVALGEALDANTGYIHSGDFYYWIIENKYALATRQGKIERIGYDRYNGMAKKTDWTLTLLTFPLFRSLLKCVPSSLKHSLIKLLWGRK